MKRRFILLLMFAVAMAAVLAAQTSPGADWPQWRGPDRTGVSKESGLMKQWLWKPTYTGRSGTGGNNDRGPGPRATPTVDGDRLYVLTENGDLACLRTQDGADFGILNWPLSEL